MLVRIPTSSAKLGMFVERIECSWWRHPFWRSRQTLTTERQLDLLVLSGAQFIVIDDEKGLAFESCHLERPPGTKARRDAKPHEQKSQASGQKIIPTVVPAHRLTRISQKQRQTEIKRARSVLNRSKHAVKQLFEDARIGRPIKMRKMGSMVDQITALIDVEPSIVLNMARLKTKDDYTFLHSVSVCALMVNLARTMRLKEPLVREAGIAGLLHDVGKIAIPDDILLKPSKLDDAEFAVVKHHPVAGYKILSASEGISAATIDVCLHHHEKMDGSGYPDNLKGEELPLLTRMAAICDVYDAVTSQRSYNVPWAPSQALSQMRSWSGHFDQMILNSFIESLGILPRGTLVRLTNDNLGVVVCETNCDYSLSTIRVFYSIIECKFINIYDFDIDRSYNSPKIISVEDPIDWNLGDWDNIIAGILDENLR